MGFVFTWQQLATIAFVGGITSGMFVFSHAHSDPKSTYARDIVVDCVAWSLFNHGCTFLGFRRTRELLNSWQVCLIPKVRGRVLMFLSTPGRHLVVSRSSPGQPRF